ncbi:MAG: hypothetical protein LBQ34_01440 [Alphaproteobacteria bacterium]|jgi:hypothetical protein|nr:hypothetical protein [Alphaproteobacteria bacterium]
MDYLVVIFLSLLTPFSLTLSDVDYSTGLGVKVSNSTNENSFSNKVNAVSITTGSRSDSDVVSVKHFGPYGVHYDLSVEYQVYPFMYKANFLQNFWVAPKASYEPLRDSAMVILQPRNSTRTKAIPIMFNQHPSFGFNLGYDAYQFKKGGEIISPYFGMQFMRVGYEGDANFDMQESFDSSIQYVVGLSYKMDSNWAAVAEMSTLYVDLRAVEGQDQDMTAQITRMKFGVVYYLNNSIAKTKENKDATYIGILKSIDPNFKNRVNESRALEEQARIEAAAAKKQADLEAKEKAKAEAEAAKAAEAAAASPEPQVQQQQQVEQQQAAPVNRLQGQQPAAPRKRFLGIF